MALWIHFTNNNSNFNPEDHTPGGSDTPGLFVYLYDDDFPVRERSRDWGYREPVIVRCDADRVELVQNDPVGNDPHRDEYFIPANDLAGCEWWRLEA